MWQDKSKQTSDPRVIQLSFGKHHTQALTCAIPGAGYLTFSLGLGIYRQSYHRVGDMLKMHTVA